MDFLNHPQVERINIEYSEKENYKRVARGKPPYPSNVCIVRLDNVIKPYANKESHTNREFSHRFWVRGHYIHFRNKNRFKYLYSLPLNILGDKGYQLNNGIISKYISAFIKGKGKLYDKRYEVVKND